VVLVAGVTCLLFAVFLWMRYCLSQPKSFLFQLLVPVRTEMRPVLLALRKGDPQASAEALARVRNLNGEQAFEDWLRSVLIEGQTTQDDAIALLGKHFDTLDRPGRDDFITLQYNLGEYPGSWLVLDFDSHTHVLKYWQISRAICGFCPHVFAFTGDWRLEGKLLAGRVGASHEGADTLPLPRLTQQQGELRLKIANLAPEVEFIDQVRLGAVALQEGEQLDIDREGRPVAWTPLIVCEGCLRPAGEGLDERNLELGYSAEARVLVVEVRNTSAFEAAMREALAQQAEPAVSTTLQVQIGDTATQELQPVGTKFLRRIALDVPPGNGGVRFRAPHDWWLLRRYWVGRTRRADDRVVWQAPSAVQGPTADARGLLLAVDQQRVCLKPSQEMELVFPGPGAPAPGTHWGYVVRMWGYYDFLPDALRRIKPK
jgi:hypothetical protein